MKQSKTNLIKLTNAGLKKGDRWLVRGIDLAVDRGEIVTLIGPNGSGKSSTAKMALGIVTPTEGSAVRTSNLKVGYVPQKVDIDWTLPLSVARLMSLTEKINSSDCMDALEKVGLSDLRNQSVQTLSGGEFQRVLLARVVARKPDLLVLDEPVQGVDYSNEIAFYELIAELRNSLNCGVLLISHDLHIVMAATDKVICLNGTICCHGTPKTVAESPEYKELFGVSASALAIYSHDHIHPPLDTEKFQSKVKEFV